MFLLVGYGLLIPGFMMLVVTVLAVLRGRLEHTEPLLATLAVGPDRRSIGHAWSALAGGAIGLLVIAAAAIMLPARDPLGVWTRRRNVRSSCRDPISPRCSRVRCPSWSCSCSWSLSCAGSPTWLVYRPIGVLVDGARPVLRHLPRHPTGGGRWLFPLNTGVVHGEWVGCSPDDAYCNLHVSGFDPNTAWWHAGTSSRCASGWRRSPCCATAATV